jgi:hypothetical protein
MDLDRSINKRWGAVRHSNDYAMGRASALCRK